MTSFICAIFTGFGIGASMVAYKRQSYGFTIFFGVIAATLFFIGVP